MSAASAGWYQPAASPAEPTRSAVRRRAVKRLASPNVREVRRWRGIVALRSGVWDSRGSAIVGGASGRHQVSREVVHGEGEVALLNVDGAGAQLLHPDFRVF